MADEYISKQTFNNAIREAVRKYPSTFYNGLEVARQIAHDMDAVDVVPVRHGRWSRIDYEPIGHDYICSVCGWKNDMASHYCPNCGAKMERWMVKHEPYNERV